MGTGRRRHRGNDLDGRLAGVELDRAQPRAAERELGRTVGDRGDVQRSGGVDCPGDVDVAAPEQRADVDLAVGTRGHEPHRRAFDKEFARLGIDDRAIAGAVAPARAGTAVVSLEGHRNLAGRKIRRCGRVAELRDTLVGQLLVPVRIRHPGRPAQGDGARDPVVVDDRRDRRGRAALERPGDTV